MDLLLKLLAVCSVSRLQTPHKHLLVFIDRLFSNLLSHLVLINCLVQLLMVTFTFLSCSLSDFLLFSVGHFDLVFDDGAPLVDLPVPQLRVVTLVLIVQLLDLVGLLL